MKNMNLNCGTSNLGGIIVTDLPRPVLIAMRDAINDILEKDSNIETKKKSRAEQREIERKKHEDAIRTAINAAHEAGFGYDGEDVWDDEDEDDDWDEYDDDDDENFEYDPCDYCPRRS